MPHDDVPQPQHGRFEASAEVEDADRAEAAHHEGHTRGRERRVGEAKERHGDETA
jgi:hypothetical protein